jgi:hypothetical protein
VAPSVRILDSMNPPIHLEALAKSVAKANAFSGVQLMWIDFSTFMRFLFHIRG